MRRLEILEGLPDEVFDALLELAYEKAVTNEYLKNDQLSAGGVDLAYWKEAFERLTS